LRIRQKPISNPGWPPSRMKRSLLAIGAILQMCGFVFGAKFVAWALLCTAPLLIYAQKKGLLVS
jgi:hypothetical protein